MEHRSRNILISVLAAAAAVALMWRFSHLVSYILIAAVITLIGNPITRLLKRISFRGRTIPPAVRAAVTIVLIWTIAILFFRFLTPLLFDKFRELSSLDLSQLTGALDRPLSKLGSFLSEYFSVDMSNFSLTQTITDYLRGLLNVDMAENLIGGIVSFLGSTVMTLFCVTFISFFFLKEESLFGNMVAALLPENYEGKVFHALQSISYLLSRYFLGLLAEMSIMLTMVTLWLLVFGFQLSDAVFIGFTVAVFKIIPYIGGWIGLFLGLVIAIASNMGMMPLGPMVLHVCISVMVSEGIDNFIIQPLLYSKQVNAHPLEIFLVIMMGGSLGGVVGMLVAVPCYTVIRVIAKEFFSTFSFVRKLTAKLPGDGAADQ